MTQRIKKYLLDAQETVASILEVLEGKAQEDFFNDFVLCLAVERLFITLGEALNCASQEKEDLELYIPDLPRIVGLRNRMVHDYDTVRVEILWDLVQEKLPLLHQRLEELL